MIIYLDRDYKCYVANNENIFTTVVTDVFNNKCQAYIEGHRLVPKGETWEREDGEVFTGLMIAPWMNSDVLEKAQFEYENTQLKSQNAEYESALTEIAEAL